MAATAQRLHHARLVGGRKLREDGAPVGDLLERVVVDGGQFAAEQHLARVEPDVTADLLGHDIVVARENLDAHTALAERFEGGGGGVLRRVEKSHETGQHELRLVGDGKRPLARWELAVRDRHHAEPVFIEFARDVVCGRGGIVIYRHHAVLVPNVRADGDDLLHGALADEFVHIAVPLDHDAHAPAREVKWDFIQLGVDRVDPQQVVELTVLQNRDVQQVAKSGLVEAVEVGEVEHALLLLAHHVQVLLENDPVLRQRPRLVGAQGVHRAEVLDGVEALDDHFPPRHHHGALGEIGAHDHGEHLGREADGDCEAEEERLEPVALGEAIEEEHHRHHDGHEANEQPAHLAYADVECGDRTLAHESLGERTENGMRAGAGNHGHRRAGDDAGAHEAECGQFDERDCGA